jgi:hypothetical protein
MTFSPRLGSGQLTGEPPISRAESITRREIAQQLCAFAGAGFLDFLEYLQPQVGCVNSCSMCSQHASTRVTQLTLPGQRRLLGALSLCVDRREPGAPLIGRARLAHKAGVIFPYLDNDILSYPRLSAFCATLAADFNVAVRLTTVGFNPDLTHLRQSVAAVFASSYLSGLRVSVTPYAWGYRLGGAARAKYWGDLAETLNLARPQLSRLGCGKDRFCVEFRSPPAIHTAPVEITRGGARVACGAYALVAAGDLTTLPLSRVRRVVQNRAELTGATLDARLTVGDKELRRGVARRFCNADGPYVFFDAEGIARPGRRPVGFYLPAPGRCGGVFDCSRPLLDALLLGRERTRGIASVGERVRARAEILERTSDGVFPGSEYAELATGTLEAIGRAGLEPFLPEHNFLVDTGPIVNQGRAHQLFAGLSRAPNVPVTPGEERGYGAVSVNSARPAVWRLAPVAEEPHASENQVVPHRTPGWRNRVGSGGSRRAAVKLERLDGWLRPVGEETCIDLGEGAITVSTERTGPGMRC